MPTQNDPRRVDRAEEIDARCIVKFRPGDNWIGEYGFDWFREGDHKEFPNYISDYKQDNLVGKYGANISGYEKDANGWYIRIQNRFKNFSGRCLYYWLANNDYYCMFNNNKIGHFVWNNNGGFHLEDLSGNSIFTYKIQLKKIPKNAQIQYKKPIAYFLFQNQQGNMFLVPKDHTTQLSNYPAYYYPGDNNTGAYYYSQIYGNDYCSIVFDNQSVCHLEDWAGNIYVCDSSLELVPTTNINGASIAYFTLEGQQGNQYMVQKDSFGQVLRYLRVFHIEINVGLFVQDENEENQSLYHLEDLSGNVYDINLRSANQTGFSKALFRCEYQQGGPVMIQDNGPWFFKVKDDQRNFFWNASTIRQYPLDPDFSEWLGINLIFGQRDEANRPCDADVFAEGQYSPIPIKNRNQKYYVPSISLFYENSTRAKNGRWGKSEAEVKMLISGENIDTDLKRITFEFECTPGIKLSHKTIKGSSITKNTDTQCYEKPLTIRLAKEFSVFSLNEGDGMINVYAKFPNGDRFLAGRLCVAKCIPLSVNIVFVRIPVQLNANDKISHFGSNVAPDVAIDGESNYLKQFLSQAHVVPNIEVRTFTKAEKIQDLQTVINDHKQIVTRRNSMGQVYSVAIALNPNQNYPLGKCLEELFNQDSPQYQDYYKIFLIGTHGTREVDVNNEETGAGLLGMSSGNPSNSAVIFELDKRYSQGFEHNNAATLTHELLHCFGLWHSFSNFRPEPFPYTLEKFRTSNIMDYQYSISLITLWKWQWEMIRNATGMQAIDTNLDVHPGFFRRLLSHLWFK